MYVRSGTSDAARDAVEWAREAESRGAGEILLTSMDRDGTRAGFDCEMTAAVSDAVNIPVIASGGAGTLDHFADVFTQGHADAALAASIFHYADTSVSELKRYLRDARDTCPVSNVRRDHFPMLIPSIDLQSGRIVQLVQGEKLAIEATDPDPWISEFSRFPRVQLIDLDAAKGQRRQRGMVADICAPASLPRRRRHSQRRTGAGRARPPARTP